MKHVKEATSIINQTIT